MRWLKYLVLSSFVGFTSLSPNFEENEPKNYALIINSDSEKQHIESVSLIDSILSKNNYETHIFDKSKERDYPVEGISTKENIEDFFQNAKIGKKDRFLLHVAGHGSRDTLDDKTFSSIKMSSGENLDPNSLEKYLKKINPKTGVLIFPQCYGREFGEKLGKENYVAVTASQDSKPSYGTSFAEGFFKAFDSPEADKNKDGKISVLEASIFGCKNDFYTPLYADYGYFLSRESSFFPFPENSIISRNRPKLHIEKTNPKEKYVSGQVIPEERSIVNRD